MSIKQNTTLQLNIQYILLALFDALMGLISDNILDSIWADIVEQEYVKAAGNVAFLLAFCSDLTADEQATVASKRRSK